MAEFKVSSGLSGEVSSLKAKTCELAKASVNIDTTDVNTLKTSMEYVRQQKRIRDLLRAYRTLVLKDCVDLEKMIKDVKAVDNILSSATK